MFRKQNVLYSLVNCYRKRDRKRCIAKLQNQSWLSIKFIHIRSRNCNKSHNVEALLKLIVKLFESYLPTCNKLNNVTIMPFITLTLCMLPTQKPLCLLIDG